MMHRMPADADFPPLITDVHVAWLRATQVCVDPPPHRCHRLCCRPHGFCWDPDEPVRSLARIHALCHA